MTLRVAVTGAEGFLGWHLLCHAKTRSDVDVVRLSRADLADVKTLAASIKGVDAVVHLAGANRGPDDEVAATNVSLAELVASAVTVTPSVRRIVYANSIHANGATTYGRSKAEAARILRQGCGSNATTADVVLPNLFGEHGRPFYNSFVATFCQQIAVGEPPKVHADGPVELMYAATAASCLLDAALGASAEPAVPSGYLTSVASVADVLKRQADQYEAGVFPDLSTAFEVRLFNQLRSYAQPFNLHDERPSRFDSPRPLIQHIDDRGGLVEIAKALGGQSQTFFSTTRPGITRGNHFHTSKVERFVVVSGEAEIALRRVGTDRIHAIATSGTEPAVLDIPTLHTHAITNVGESELLTLFWADEVFDPEAPDTYAEPVAVSA